MMGGTKKWTRTGKIVAINREVDGFGHRVEPEELARRVLQDHHLEQTMPIPVIDVCLAEGIIAVRQGTFKDPGVSGMIRHTGEGHVIYVRAIDPPVRQRFTMAHELGHYLLHIRGDRNQDELSLIERGDVEALYRRTDQVNERERAANLFAAALLMPTTILRMLGDAYKPRTLAQFLAVSEEALKIRLKSFA